MSRFTIEIPPVTSDQDLIRTQALEEANRFVHQKLGREPVSPFTWKRPRMEAMLDDLRKGRLSPLFLADGRYVPRLSDMDDIHPEKPNWARNHFNKKELQVILDICSKMALTLPTEPDYSQEQKGHSVLYGAIASKSSIFHEALTPDVRKRLNNGRFWEELPEVAAGINLNVSARVIGDIVGNHFTDLDPEFASIGSELFKRNNHHRTHALTKLDQFSERELDNYVTFVARVDKNAEDLGADPKVLEEMVSPYVVEVASSVEKYQDSYIPKYGQKSKRFFGLRLKDELVFKYITGSEYVRDSLAQQLYYEMQYGSQEHVFHVLAFLPNSKQIFDLMLRKLYPRTGADKMAVDLMKQGLPIADYCKIPSSAA